MTAQEKIILKPENSRGERAVFLELPAKPGRYIGYLKNRTFYTRRKVSEHTFKKADSLGMNYKLLSEGAAFFDIIEIDYGFSILKTSRQYFLEHGYFLHFKGAGYERQIFLSISDFNKPERVSEPVKNDSASQGVLFA